MAVKQESLRGGGLGGLVYQLNFSEKALTGRGVKKLSLGTD